VIPPVLLLGFGKMGQALAGGWCEGGLAPSYAIDPGSTSADSITCLASLADLPANFRPAAIVLAVKPQMAPATVPALARFAPDALFVSIMAGCTLAGLGAMLGAQAAIVRAMPNMPAALRQGITVACACPTVDFAGRSLADRLLSAVGTVEWTKEEGDLDAVTAISGGGPAYVFLLCELLEQAGVAQGLSTNLARALARRTVSGAGAMLAASETDAAVLRAAVTSPKGTTERALAVLLAEWPEPLARAVAASIARSRALSG
jgi:pyrroline-5-carboxylate reductase